MTHVKTLGALVLGATALILIFLYSRSGSTTAGRDGSALGPVVSTARLSRDIDETQLAESTVQSDAGRNVIPEADLPPDTHKEMVLGETAAAAENPFYAQERSRCLSTFLTESPDVPGWNGYLEILASSAELGSVYDDGGEIKGSFVIPEAGITVEFSITEEGYRITSQGTEAIGGLGTAEFQASLAFQVKDGRVAAAHGVVQFHPSDELDLDDTGLVGYTYKTGEQQTSFAPIHGSFSDGGRYSISVFPLDAGQTINTGGLGSAHSWMHRLSEVERLHSSRKAERPSQR